MRPASSQASAVAIGCFGSEVWMRAAVSRRISAAAAAGWHRIAHGHAALAVAVALVGLVDLLSGEAADHGADRRGRIAPGPAADLAADHRAEHAAEHRRHRASALAAA